MNPRHLIPVFLFGGFLSLFWTIPRPLDAEEPPRLVLQITVDQLRGDDVMRFRDRFRPGGFRHFLDRGTHYLNAHYLHANTETAPGHATLVTGGHPTRHGIVANDWIDQRTHEFVYNTEDDRHHIIGSEPRPHTGVSPRNLLSSTIGDEIVLSNAGRSRAFSVSPKDRGAILPGGHTGKAYWYSKRSGQFVTSTYYHDDYPAWVKEWNEAKLADRYKNQSWTLIGDRDTYIARDLDDRPFEVEFDALGRTFPHPLGDGSSKFFYTVVGLTPMVDELALDFAKALLKAEEVGQRGETDYLAISFSSPDYTGHMFGISSLEHEDAVRRLDRLLAELFAFVDEHVGLDRTLVILSADHGGQEAPEYITSLGKEAGRFPLDFFRQKPNPISEALRERYGRDDLLATHSHPYLYLNLDAIAEAKLDIGEIENFVVDELVKIPGIMYAFARSDLIHGRIAEAPMLRMVRRSFHPTRSGNLHLIQEQHWLLHSTDEAAKMGISGDLPAIHGSPWVYDTYVPILFAGPGVPSQTVTRLVAPNDIAPTIAAYLGVKPPSGSVGQPLHEVLTGFLGGRKRR